MSGKFDGSFCPRCNVRVRVQLSRGAVCSDCESAEAWRHYGGPGVRLAIDHAAIAEAERRRAGEDAGESAVRKGVRALPGVAAGLLGVAAAAALGFLFRPQPLGPLDEIFAALGRMAGATTLLGAGALGVGVASMIAVMKGRYFRSKALLAANCLGIVAGTAAVIVGGLNWYGATTGFGWSYVAMPVVEAHVSHVGRAIMNATAVIVAPDGDGDARGVAIGAGAVIRSEKRRTWIVSCSHVAMPYAAVASIRNAAEAHPVWVYFSDGRNAQGRVRWTAQPPLDVAVVSVEIDDPPAAVEISRDSDSILRGAAVSFVPNPFRSGWDFLHGEVSKREPHDTPAGVYSLLYTNLPLQPGDSGTGLFDRRGRLIGLNTWGLASGGATSCGYVGISLPSTSMQKILDLIDKDELDKLDLLLPERGAAR
ncbi:MAG: serine protease [Planctomycetota bacterium]|nr:serine protease [Planctomycetota bacterium]